MLLLTGPPGSGKTYRLLEKVRDSARRGAADIRLIVPTATFAEHLRNELAREGLLVRPEAVETLFGFVDQLAGDPRQVAGPVLRQLVRASIAEIDSPALRAVSSMPGLQRAVADLIEELDAAGVDFATGTSSHFEPVLAIAVRVREMVEQRGFRMRSDRFRKAADRVRSGGLPDVREVLFDGFFRFTQIELELIRGLAESVDVTVTLPSGESTARTRDALVAIGFEEHECSHSQKPLGRKLFLAPSPEREAEEIVRRVLEENGRGKVFREIGVVLRSRAPYVPVLRRAFARFGIPARFYFAEPLDSHPSVRRIAAIVESMLNGWDHEDLLDAVRLYPASVETDRLEYRLLEGLPNKGMPAEHELSEQLGDIDSWRIDKLTPSDWVQRLSELTKLFPHPDIADHSTHDDALRWRSHAAALDNYCGCLETCAESIGDARAIPLAEYWQETKSIITATDLRVADNRRNVVHIMDAYEARQWRLPVVFVCGLNDRLFPVHHAENPLLGDAAREALRKDGIDLMTSRDHDVEERFLFDVATTRATEILTLSYAAFDNAGEQKLPSLFLQQLRQQEDLPTSPAILVRPRPKRARPVAPRPAVRDSSLLDAVAARHTSLSASSIERFLQCPFAFFAERTLRLREMPLPPHERLNPLLEGDIVHAVLAELFSRKDAFAEWERIFEREFETGCRKAQVPPGYRRETAKLELRASLERFVANSISHPQRTAETELEFEFPLADGLTLIGRMDRVHRDTSGGPVVIDYKYSQPSKLREYVRGNEEGQLVQAGVYLAAARALAGRFPGGMLFCALRDGVDWKGWHTLAEWESITPMSNEVAIAGLIETALETSREAASRIRAGETDADPADETKCSYCSSRDICRVEVAPVVRVAGGKSN